MIAVKELPIILTHWFHVHAFLQTADAIVNRLLEAHEGWYRQGQSLHSVWHSLPLLPSWTLPLQFPDSIHILLLLALTAQTPSGKEIFNNYRHWESDIISTKHMAHDLKSPVPSTSGFHILDVSHQVYLTWNWSSNHLRLSSPYGVIIPSWYE